MFTDRKMDRDAVVAYINDEVTYKPGWRITATPEDQDGVRLMASFTAPNSNMEDAREGYPNESIVTPIPTHTLRMGTDLVNEGGILDVLLIWLVDIEIHEAREFLRVKSDDFYAPFHPHRWAGQMRWENARATWPTSFPEPQGDREVELARDAEQFRSAAEVAEAWRKYQEDRPIQGFGGLPPGLEGLPPELARLLAGGGDESFDDDRW